MTAAGRRHLAAVVALGCLIHEGAPAEAHHVRRDGGKRDDMRVLALCPWCHRLGPPGVAIHAGRESWEREHGTEAWWLDEVERRLAA